MRLFAPYDKICIIYISTLLSRILIFVQIIDQFMKYSFQLAVYSMVAGKITRLNNNMCCMKLLIYANL